LLLQRFIVALVLLPIGLWVIYLGGIPYTVVIALLVGIAAWEFARLFQAGGWQPSRTLTVAGVLLLLLARFFENVEAEAALLALLILVSMTYHLMKYERGRDESGTDFALTLAGILYMGVLGGYFLSLRNLPEGKWWVLVVLPAIWFADSGAYFIGRRFGRRPFSPRLSPKKTWEGYLGGVLMGILGTALLTWALQGSAGPGTEVTVLRGALVGGLLAVIAPLGDLGESMIKRQVGIKDSSNLLPGHGGAFDRIDSWLWAAPIGYYLVRWLIGL
jgi:phosphatidate cytidylyltransferase